jgi:hypothetical protein
MNQVYDYKKKQAFLRKHVFTCLQQLNPGFDVESNSHFSEEEIAIVFDRIQKLGIGIFGIEAYMNDDDYDCQVREMSVDRLNDKWYLQCFENFRELKLPLKYYASFDIPEEYLEHFQE